MAFSLAKWLLPNRPVQMRVWSGPFRGARVVMNPRHSMRKVLGLYEHELNEWMEFVLHRVNRVIDVGANDGYFTFGCAAAFRRLRRSGEVMAFEPQDEHFATLRQGIDAQPLDQVQITLIQSVVGARRGTGTKTLDGAQWNTGDPGNREGALLKIDVEGAEMEVLAGALSWLNPRNFFLIEVHKEPFLEAIVRLFAAQGLTLDRIDHRPLPLIGGELREEQNWWLVSNLHNPQ